MTFRAPIAALLLCLVACGGAAEPDEAPVAADDAGPPVPADSAEPLAAEIPDALDENPSSGDLLPMPMRVIWEPWHGDLDEIGRASCRERV